MKIFLGKGDFWRQVRAVNQPHQMNIPHTTILTSFTATETFKELNGFAITVHTLTRDNTRETFWRYTATTFKTFSDGFDAPKMRRECWNDSTASDMIERFKSAQNCRCAFIR